MLETGESIVSFADFFIVESDFSISVNIASTRFDGDIRKEKSNQTSLHNFMSIKVNN